MAFVRTVYPRVLMNIPRAHHGIYNSCTIWISRVYWICISEGSCMYSPRAHKYTPPLLHTAYLYFSHTPGTRQSETRLVEGVRFQLIEGRTRPLLRQLETHDVSEDDPSEARLKELVLAKVEAVK